MVINELFVPSEVTEVSILDEENHQEDISLNNDSRPEVTVKVEAPVEDHADCERHSDDSSKDEAEDQQFGLVFEWEHHSDHPDPEREGEHEDRGWEGGVHNPVADWVAGGIELSNEDDQEVVDDRQDEDEHQHHVGIDPESAESQGVLFVAEGDIDVLDQHGVESLQNLEEYVGHHENDGEGCQLILRVLQREDDDGKFCHHPGQQNWEGWLNGFNEDPAVVGEKGNGVVSGSCRDYIEVQVESTHQWREFVEGDRQSVSVNSKIQNVHEDVGVHQESTESNSDEDSWFLDHTLTPQERL